MRVTKYVKSDGENWMLLKIRCSAHVSYNRLNALLRKNGWVPWRLVKHKFDELKKKLAATNPTKFPNWKQIEIPMRVAGKQDVPQQIRAENEAKQIEILEVPNESTPTASKSETRIDRSAFINAGKRT